MALREPCFWWFGCELQNLGVGVTTLRAIFVPHIQFQGFQMNADKFLFKETQGAFKLRNRFASAALSLLFPGAGHLYQRRLTKSLLFGSCVILLWFAGFYIGGRNVVYASLHHSDFRWQFISQVCVGVLSAPAAIQAYHLSMHDALQNGVIFTDREYRPLWSGFMAPPVRPISEEMPDQISAWNGQLGQRYELGTWLTMIAGLLNILVAYDALCGPAAISSIANKP